MFYGTPYAVLYGSATNSLFRERNLIMIPTAIKLIITETSANSETEAWRTERKTNDLRKYPLELE